MSELKTDLPEFESTVFPTEADMRIWDSLTPAQQRAVILRDIERGRSGLFYTADDAKAIINGMFSSHQDAI